MMIQLKVMNIGKIVGMCLRRTSCIMRVRFSSEQSFDPNKDYYKVLGIDQRASEADIKRAFYELAKQYHPDQNAGRETQFKAINQAYEILSSHKLRNEYDNAIKYQNLTDDNHSNFNDLNSDFNHHSHSSQFGSANYNQNSYYGPTSPKYSTRSRQYRYNGRARREWNIDNQFNLIRRLFKISLFFSSLILLSFVLSKSRNRPAHPYAFHNTPYNSSHQYIEQNDEDYLHFSSKQYLQFLQLPSMQMPGPPQQHRY